VGVGTTARDYLFDAQALLAQLRARGVKVGIATSAANQYWDAAEVRRLACTSSATAAAAARLTPRSGRGCVQVSSPAEYWTTCEGVAESFGKRPTHGLIAETAIGS
jgi:hypothetical protein